MSSIAEKIASSISMTDLKKSSALKQRIFFTIMVLIIYRVGSFIPLPGVDASALKELFSGEGSGLLDIFNSFTGGALSRMTIFALNIIPYISASIIMQMMTFVTPSLSQLRKEGPSGQQKINQYTRYLTILICLIQGYGMAMGLMATEGAVINPGGFFIFSTMVSLLAGTMLVMWMGEQITIKGIGQGSSLIIFAGIITTFPTRFMQLTQLANVGQIQPITLMAIIAGILALFYVTVFVEMAQRRISIHYPKRANMMGNQNMTHMPLKLNLAGVLPPIFAQSLVGIPALIATFLSKAGVQSNSLQLVNSFLQIGSLTYIIVVGLLIVFFSFMFASLHFNPEETAENLKDSGAFIPGIRPGESTAKYFDYITTRLTVFGAGFLAVICLLPDYVTGNFGVMLISGTGLLIIVNVIMETISQIQSHLISSQYEAIMKSAGKQKRRFR
ncbi:MAG: preprotein translocase subunit SecY [Alphaproteobacteria bacterium]|jgi:preprotein translocase subunit SecY|nr:preprotein translocase subunit SecY [Alphaproteobacteria bacterium]